MGYVVIWQQPSHFVETNLSPFVILNIRLFSFLGHCTECDFIGTKLPLQLQKLCIVAYYALDVCLRYDECLKGIWGFSFQFFQCLAHESFEWTWHITSRQRNSVDAFGYENLFGRKNWRSFITELNRPLRWFLQTLLLNSRSEGIWAIVRNEICC